jgi:putative transcription antitermination factor YqgF
MPLYLSIDPGLSHTGFATSDSTRLVQPLTTVHAKDLDQIFSKTLSVIKEQKPDQIVIGLPPFGPIRSLAQNLFNDLKTQFKGKIYLFPEDLSSKRAIKKLVQSGGTKQSRRYKKHSASAAIILQDFLNSQPI